MAARLYDLVKHATVEELDDFLKQAGGIPPNDPFGKTKFDAMRTAEICIERGDAAVKDCLLNHGVKSSIKRGTKVFGAKNMFDGFVEKGTDRPSQGAGKRPSEGEWDSAVEMIVRDPGCDPRDAMRIAEQDPSTDWGSVVRAMAGRYFMREPMGGIEGFDPPSKGYPDPDPSQGWYDSFDAALGHAGGACGAEIVLGEWGAWVPDSGCFFDTEEDARVVELLLAKGATVRFSKLRSAFRRSGTATVGEWYALLGVRIDKMLVESGVWSESEIKLEQGDLRMMLLRGNVGAFDWAVERGIAELEPWKQGIKEALKYKSPQGLVRFLELEPDASCRIDERLELLFDFCWEDDERAVDAFTRKMVWSKPMLAAIKAHLEYLPENGATRLLGEWLDAR